MPAEACSGNPLYYAIDSKNQFYLGINKQDLAKLFMICAYDYQPPTSYWSADKFLSCPNEWRDGGKSGFLFIFSRNLLVSYTVFNVEGNDLCPEVNVH